jgi:hypothetical protein
VVTVIWDPSASARKITVKPYSVNWAEGNELDMDVNIINNGSIIWTGATQEWGQRFNWNIFCLPQYCHDVIIGGEYPHPVFPYYKEAEIQSLLISDGQKLHIEDGGKLTVAQNN